MPRARQRLFFFEKQLRGKYGTSLDRVEPDLNQATPGDPRDTTMRDAMLKTMRKIVTGDSLSPASRDQITRWLIANNTGDKKLHAGLPAGWRAGDKTGGGGHGTNNDIAVLCPAGRAPVLVTSFLTQTLADLGFGIGRLRGLGGWWGRWLMGMRALGSSKDLPTASGGMQLRSVR